MEGVRGDLDVLPWRVEAMELAGADTDIKAIRRPSRVGVLTCRTHVEGVVPVPLHPHGYPDLPGGVVQVVDLYRFVRPGLRVRADVASRGGHGAGDRTESSWYWSGAVLVLCWVRG